MSVPSASVLTLYTIAMSHYSEKIRWLLDYEEIPYREVALTPVFHVWPALRMGLRAQTTVPLLKDGATVVQDSTRIIERLDDERGPLRAMPPALRAPIMAVEDRFDAIGKDVARYLYHGSFGQTQEILRLWTRFATPLQNRLIRLGYPAIKEVFKLKLNINAQSARRAEQRIDQNLRWLESHLASGQRYLVGDQFSVADLTAAALLAPMACPPEHPVYGQASFRDHMASSNPLWRSRPGLDWVRSIYAQHRGPVWKVLPRPN